MVNEVFSLRTSTVIILSLSMNKLLKHLYFCCIKILG